MARKRVLISWLATPPDEKPIRELLGVLGKAGLGAEAGAWNRDLAKVGWAETADPLAADPPDLWLVVGTAADFADRDVRLGLSLARVALRAKAPRPVPLVIATLDQPVRADSLPPLLADARELAPPPAAWGARLVALAHTPTPPPATEDFRLSVVAHPALGLWFEAGPAAGGQWRGAIFGVDSGEITHQGVGEARLLPERCVLEYPSQGIQVEAAGRTFTCWAVQNSLDAGHSHFVRVTGNPGHLLFGELPGADAADLSILALV